MFTFTPKSASIYYRFAIDLLLRRFTTELNANPDPYLTISPLIRSDNAGGAAPLAGHNFHTQFPCAPWPYAYPHSYMVPPRPIPSIVHPPPPPIPFPPKAACCLFHYTVVRPIPGQPASRGSGTVVAVGRGRSVGRSTLVGLIYEGEWLRFPPKLNSGAASPPAASLAIYGRFLPAPVPHNPHLVLALSCPPSCRNFPESITRQAEHGHTNGVARLPPNCHCTALRHVVPTKSS